MTLFHAVVWTDHHKAQVLRFDAEQVRAQKVKSHTHHTHHTHHARQHGELLRTEPEFFGDLCDALAGVKEILVTGPATALADFRRYVDQHRPEIAHRIVRYESAVHPSDGQLVAFARQYFARYDLMSARR